MSDGPTLPDVDYATPGASLPQPPRYGLTPQVFWTRVGLITLVFVGVFWPNLRRLWLKTNFVTGDANWQHAPLVPLIGLYYLYLNREALAKTPLKPILWDPFLRWGRLGVGLGLLLAGATTAWVTSYTGDWMSGAIVSSAAQAVAVLGFMVLAADWGLGVMLFGLFSFGYGIWPGQNDFVKDLGMVITLFGVVTMLCGWEVMKIAWFPIVFLVAAIPWPTLVYSRLAMPLQELSAGAAVATLKLSGVDAVREGTKLVIGVGANSQTLNVAEACAGLKSLMAFITLAAAIGFLSSRPLWQKLSISASAVPIAIFCNMMRVSGQGLLHHYVSEKLSEGFAHQFVGLVMLIPAFFLVQGLAWFLDHLFVEEEDKGRARQRHKRGDEDASLVIEIPRHSGSQPAVAAATSAPVEHAPQEDLALATQRLMSASLRKRPARAEKILTLPGRGQSPNPLPSPGVPGEGLETAIRREAP